MKDMEKDSEEEINEKGKGKERNGYDDMKDMKEEQCKKA